MSFSIFMYHQVGSFVSMRRHRANYCRTDRFVRQMWLLKVLGCEVLDLDRALQDLALGKPLKRPQVVLTFDDGYENFMTQAWPVLSRYDFPALVYVLAGRLGGEANWFEPERKPYPRLLDQDQVLELRSQGVTVGSHGLRHLRLSGLSEEELNFELVRSKQILEGILKEEVGHFCYPYGSYDQAVLKAVRQAGYRTGTTCLRGAVTRAFHPLELPRKAVSFGDSLLGFWWKLFFKDRPKRPPLWGSRVRQGC